MRLTADQIRQVAHLARLELDDGQVDRISDQLGRILDFVGQLSAADTEGVEPMAHPLEMEQPRRADEVSERDERAAFQALAPATERGLYLVPKVID